MKRKLAIITELIAPYRIPVFNALARRSEVDLHVIFLSENDPSLRQWRVYKDEIDFHYDVLPCSRLRVSGYQLLINRDVTATLNKIAPDAILCGGYNYPASWQATYWAKRYRVPFLLWSESTALDARNGRRPIEFLKARFLRFCHGFVVPGLASSDYLSQLGIPPQRIFSAPNAVDNALFCSAAGQARSKNPQIRADLSLPSRYFLYVGRIVKAKGVFELLEAYSQLNADLRAEVGLVLVGDGPDLPELQRQAFGINPGAVQFRGFVHREGLPNFYALADALVFPTHSDTWGLVANEAMACGLPVIVSNVAGCARDLVQNEWNGLIVQANDPASLCGAMSRLACDPVLRREMGSRSRQRIESYSPESWSEGIVKAVSQI